MAVVRRLFDPALLRLDKSAGTGPVIWRCIHECQEKVEIVAMEPPLPPCLGQAFSKPLDCCGREPNLYFKRSVCVW